MHDLLTTLYTTPGNIIILGDFNIHVNDPPSYSVAEFNNLLDSLNFTQHVNVPTHSRGHTLDLLITNSTSISNLSVHDLGVSDHKAISLELPTLSPISKPSRKISFRNLTNINPVTLTTDLRHLSAANPLSVTKSVDLYNSSLSSLLDHHAPVKSRTVTFTRSAPWYTRELRLQRRTGRVLERCFKDSGLAVYKLAYREHQKAYSKSLSDTRSRFYSHIINNSLGNSKQLFSTINHLLKPQTPLHLDNTQERCNSFIRFFKTKVEKIRSLLSSFRSGHSQPPPASEDKASNYGRSRLLFSFRT
ncbi:unnamed protein product [Leuciscus chuanchicus]